jgi:hypothetical protein
VVCQFEAKTPFTAPTLARHHFAAFGASFAPLFASETLFFALEKAPKPLPISNLLAFKA